MSLITKQGLERLKQKLIEIEIDQEINKEDLAKTRAFGDFKENAEYGLAKDKLAQLSMAHMNTKSAIAESIIFEKNWIQKDIVGFGAEVTCEDENMKIFKYKILSAHESDLKNNIIAIESPLAQSFLKKKVNDEVVVYAPSGEKNYYIIDINYDWIKF